MSAYAGYNREQRWFVVMPDWAPPPRFFVWRIQPATLALVRAPARARRARWLSDGAVNRRVALLVERP